MNNLHRYLKIIPKFKNREQAKNDFISLSREIYSGNRNTKDFTDFERNYNGYDRENVLKWYTRESFLYKVANNCLRIATSDSIQYCRLLLKDIQEAIKEQYQLQSKNYNGLLYRAAYLSGEEWSNLKENTGREIETHGFLSASKNKNVALKFLQMDPSKKVFITIIVPKGPTEEEQGFAEIEEFSRFPHEKEVLFNVRSRFTVLETDEMSPEEISSRHLVLFYGAQSFRRFVSEKNPVQEVSIPKNISCSQCKAPSPKMSEKMMFVPIENPGNDNYSCERCLPNFIELNTAPLLCIPFVDNLNCKLANLSKIEIKGCLLKKGESQTLFYGYKCSECRDKKQKMYFVCTTCDEGGKKWCENCFKKKPDCFQQGHTLILESSPFSFWREQMSKKELNHLKVQNTLVLDSEFFQQASMYLKSNEHERAIEYYQAYIHTNKTEDKDGKIVACYNNLGEIYNYQSNHKKALEYHFKALDISLSVSRENDSEVANSYYGLGNGFLREKEYKKALEYHLKALEIRKVLYENTHSDVTSSFKKIGEVYESLGDFKKALEYHLRYLDIEISVYGENHPNIAIYFGNIGRIYRCLGEYKKALEYSLKSLDIDISVYGENHPKIAAGYHFMGALYLDQKDQEMALKFLFKALDIIKSLDGENSPNVAHLYDGIGITCQEQKDHEMALEFLLKSLDIRRSIYGNIHPIVGCSYNYLGEIFQKEGEYDTSLDFFKKSLEIHLALHQENHPDVADCYQNLGKTFESLEDQNKALESYLKCLDINLLVYGEINPNIAVCYQNLGRVFENLGKHKKALEDHLKSLNINVLVYGENNLHVADCYRNIGMVYKDLREYEKALEYHLKTLDIVVSIHGENHLFAANCYCNIGIAYEDLGEDKKALECYLKSHDISTLLSGEAYLQTEEAQDVLDHITELSNVDF